MNMAYFISAYATSPSFNQWDPLDERKYFQALASEPEVVGIEHPFFINSEKYPLSWLLENIPDHWSIIITALPAFMHEAKNNPLLGLASENEAGRRQAVQLMQAISQYSEKLNHIFNRKIVKAIHFHSLPRNDDVNRLGNKAALKQSLYDIQKFNWHGAELNLEHCDAYIPNQLADKGFLLLKDELEVLSEVGGYGIVLNWARSAIEGRSVMTPLRHIELTQHAALLRGFFFSGCTDNPESDYGCWKDTHIPPKNFIESEYLRNESLLGAKEIKQVLNVLDREIYYGIKILDQAKLKKLTQSIGLNIDTIRAINAVISS